MFGPVFNWGLGFRAQGWVQVLGLGGFGCRVYGSTEYSSRLLRV